MSLSDVKKFIESTHCLSLAKEKTQAFKISATILPNFFLRFSPIELSKIFSQTEFDAQNDDNLSTITDISESQDLSPEKKLDLTNRINSAISALNFITSNLLELEKSDPKMVLGLVLFTAACTEYTDQIRDLELFMQDIEFVDAKYDIESIEKEVMVERIFDNLGIFLGDKSTTPEKIDAFLNSVKNNPNEFGVIFQTDKFGNPYYSLLKAHLFKDSAFLLACIKK